MKEENQCKQNQYRFNLSFDESDEDHRRVCEFLNSCGRKKARFVVKAILAYWELMDGQYATKKIKKHAEEEEEKSADGVHGRVINLDDDFKIDPTEAALMKQNYAVFEEIE